MATLFTNTPDLPSLNAFMSINSWLHEYFVIVKIIHGHASSYK